MNSQFLSDEGWYDDLEPARTIVTGRIVRCGECDWRGPEQMLLGHREDTHMLPTPEQMVAAVEAELRKRRGAA